MIEARLSFVLILLVLVDVLVLGADEHDSPVDVNVVVAVVQRVQPRQNGQRGAERAKHETGCGSPATHSGRSLEHVPDPPPVTISRRRVARSLD
jgi:hypothetical protein